NGRVARAVASVYSYRAASVPLLIFADRRFEYFDALQSADLGDTRPLVRFFFDAGITAMNLVTENARTARAPDAHDAFRNLQVLLTAQGGLTHQELDQVANNFINSGVTIIKQHAEELVVPRSEWLAIGRDQL